MGAGVLLWEKLHSSLSSIAPVLKGPSIGRHYGACSSEWVLILPRLPSGAGLWPGTFFKRCTITGYTDRQPWCIFFTTQFPHKLSMLPLYLFPVSSMEKCSQEPCLDTVLTLKILSFIYWCLSSLLPPITSEFTDEPLEAIQSTLNPITAQKLDQYMKGHQFCPLKGLWHCSQCS